jgi:RHS repeat-associated protein
MGNRLTKNATSYTYNAADRLTSVGGTSSSYDFNGNLTARGSDRFGWDAADRLTSATVRGATTSFGYNGDGLRESFTSGGSTTTFTWDIAAGLPQVLDDGTFRYIYGIGRIGEVSGTNTYYYLPDGLGSVVALTNAAGAVVNTYDYDVFGALRGSTGTQANAFTFTGEQTDGNTGLQYLRARYYDPAVGRFIGRDPLAGMAWSPQSLNRYAYALNNPVRLTDPAGLSPTENNNCWDPLSRLFCAVFRPQMGPGGLYLFPDWLKDWSAIGGGGGAGGARHAADDGASIVSHTAQREANQGVAYLRGFMSRAERNAFDANPQRGSWFQGQAVHRATAQAVEKQYPGRFRYSTRGPDFFDTPTGDLIELTTPGQLPSHAARPGYEAASYATYVLPR